MEKLATDKQPYLTRGKVAKQLKINAETLRYYETQKLIKKPKRLVNNYRVYDIEDVKRIKFILIAKSLGFSLDEVDDLLQLSIEGEMSRAKMRAIAQKKSQTIAEKMKQLAKIKKALDKLITECLQSETTTKCPILQCLDS